VITVERYDASWAERFDQLRAAVDDALHAAGVPFRSVEHVGSTSVPGLAAKPIIDCDIIVAADQVAAASAVVAGLGFEARGDLGIPLRYAFLPPADWLDVHLYVVVDGSLALRNHLAVRDVLRHDATLRQEYAAVKRQLADTTHDIDVYGQGKSEVLQRILAAAGITDDERASVAAANVPPGRRHADGWPRVLVTGMSGTGKSTLVALLRERGVTAVDTDDGYVDVLDDGSQRWRVTLVRSVLETPRATPLVVAGCEENMVEVLDGFDLVVLLSAPRAVLVERLASRTTNRFGRSPDELARILDDLDVIEPRLRAIADHELVTTVPAHETADELMRLIGHGAQ
jgi:GrpB-like predicted nucleotidyltransferase (UPF0157 family)/adenylate kinase family enzyme